MIAAWRPTPTSTSYPSSLSLALRHCVIARVIMIGIIWTLLLLSSLTRLPVAHAINVTITDPVISSTETPVNWSRAEGDPLSWQLRVSKNGKDVDFLATNAPINIVANVDSRGEANGTTGVSIPFTNGKVAFEPRAVISADTPSRTFKLVAVVTVNLVDDHQPALLGFSNIFSVLPRQSDPNTTSALQSATAQIITATSLSVPTTSSGQSKGNKLTAGRSIWLIIGPVLSGTVVIATAIGLWYWRTRQKQRITTGTIDEAGFDPGSDRPPSQTRPNMNVVNTITSVFITKTQRRAEQHHTTNVFAGSHRTPAADVISERPLVGSSPGPRRAADAGPVNPDSEVSSEESTLPPDYEEVFSGATLRRNNSLRNDDQADLDRDRRSQEIAIVSKT